MSTMLERLRRLHETREQHRPRAPILPPMPAPTGRGELSQLVAGEIVENQGGLCYLATQRHALDELRGELPLGSLLAQQPQALAAADPAGNLQGLGDFAQTAFIDTETTGLGGVGVYAFMIGVGTFEAGDAGQEFVVRQIFMRSPDEEAAALVALADLLAERQGLVTFNGRSFDLPLLRTRYSQNRALLPDSHREVPLFGQPAPHLDLLPPARRLWRRRLQSCRLAALEAQILGVERSEEDLPGSLIPALYIRYLQSGDAGELARVFYHNREDITSMVALAERLCRFHAEPFAAPQAAALHGLELIALGQQYERSAQWAEAEQAYSRAVERLAGDRAQAAAFAHLAQLQKRQRRWAEASATWQRWISSVADPDPTPFIELAKYCEWQTQEIAQAAMWTGWALHNLSRQPAAHPFAHQIPALAHRQARLQRKLHRPH